ncbi:ATP-binding cassette domain-containing protein [Haliangium ochraceum]|uniref:ABC transporter related protein n=1 Tax=Haliangium ochraceum (strain DSM 14365 / JCM 11303 / SMP-2) TaxID=502025 RepID=D0LYJ8_HALO1|nr:ATP-binding cassette domain-containing protein [Haliangium ochraceum]ACY17864.1 ABC transporter related protein [Haliangium ochraceum DSM 14365]
MRAIETSGLSKSYGDVRALRDVSFSIEKGEIIGLLGPNGAGKTTLMKILTGYMQADEGQAQVAGIDVADDPLGVQARIGYLPENAPVYRDMTVREYLIMMAELRDLPGEKLGGLIGEAIEATGLGGYVDRLIGNLSKGYRQRVGLAQALLHQPELLILDEPTTGLDPTQIVEIRELIKNLSKRSTILLSTHILPEVEMTCERVLIIIRGQLRADAKLEELRAANAAIVAIEEQDDAGEVERALRGIEGVDGVEQREAAGGFRRWRVTSDSNDALCPAVFDLMRERAWRVSELRSDARTLETVFRELANAPSAAAVASEEVRP